MLRDDIICALSTPQGIGALAIIRVSGENSHSIITPFLILNVYLRLATNRTGPILEISIKEEQIDEVLITFFDEEKVLRASLKSAVTVLLHRSTYYGMCFRGGGSFG